MERELETEGPEMLCGGCLWDPKHDYEQVESLNAATTSSCQLGFEKVNEFKSSNNERLFRRFNLFRYITTH